MPLSSVNYSGGIIISDWYSSEQNSNESIKVSIRFLTNEIRSDALNIKVFKNCCVIGSNPGNNYFSNFLSKIGEPYLKSFKKIDSILERLMGIGSLYVFTSL